MANATFPPDEIDNERPVVIEEIMRHYDDTNSILYDNFSKTIFKQTPYKRSVIGNENIIKNVPRQDIIDYYKAHYVPQNMCLSVAGDLDTQKTISLIKATFGKQENRLPPAQPGLTEPLHTGETAKESKKVSMTYMLGGFLGPEPQPRVGRVSAELEGEQQVAGFGQRRIGERREVAAQRHVAQPQFAPVGQLNREAALAHCQAIARATDLPVAADLENGFTHSPTGVAETVRLAASDNPADLGPQDHVILCVKGYGLPQAAPVIEPL